MNKIFKYFVSAEANGIHLFLLLFIFALPLTYYNTIPAAIIEAASFFVNYIHKWEKII